MSKRLNLYTVDGTKMWVVISELIFSFDESKSTSYPSSWSQEGGSTRFSTIIRNALDNGYDRFYLKDPTKTDPTYNFYFKIGNAQSFMNAYRNTGASYTTEWENAFLTEDRVWLAPIQYAASNEYFEVNGANFLITGKLVYNSYFNFPYREWTSLYNLYSVYQAEMPSNYGSVTVGECEDYLFHTSTYLNFTDTFCPMVQHAFRQYWYQYIGVENPLVPYSIRMDGKHYSNSPYDSGFLNDATQRQIVEAFIKLPNTNGYHCDKNSILGSAWYNTAFNSSYLSGMSLDNYSMVADIGNPLMTTATHLNNWTIGIKQLDTNYWSDYGRSLALSWRDFTNAFKSVFQIEEIEDITTEMQYPYVPETKPVDTSIEYDVSSDDIQRDIESARMLSNTARGTENIYQITRGELDDILEQLYDKNDPLFDPEYVSRFFDNNPAQGILSVKAFHLAEKTNAKQNIYIHSINTDVQGHPMDLVSVWNSGTLAVDEFYGSFMDYTAMTEIQLFIPMYGFISLPVDEVMDSKIDIDYVYSNVTGDAFVTVNCTRVVDGTTFRAPIWHGECNVSFDVQYGKKDVLGERLKIAGAVAKLGGSLLADVVDFNLNSPSQDSKGHYYWGGKGASTNPFKNMAKGRRLTTAGQMGAISYAERAVEQVADFVTALHGVVEYDRGGSFGSEMSYFGCLRPYLIIKRAILQAPDNYFQLFGTPNNIRGTIATENGFCQVGYIHLTNFSGTDNEREELVSILRGGVMV